MGVPESLLYPIPSDLVSLPDGTVSRIVGGNWSRLYSIDSRSIGTASPAFDSYDKRMAARDGQGVSNFINAVAPGRADHRCQ